MVWNRHDVICIKKTKTKLFSKKILFLNFFFKIEKKLNTDGKSFLDQLFFRTFCDPDFSKFLIKRSGCVLVLN